MLEVSIDYFLNDHYEETVDKEDKNEEYTVYKNYHIEKNLWLLITIVSIIILLVTYIISFFVEMNISSDQSGFIGFL